MENKISFKTELKLYILLSFIMTIDDDSAVSVPSVAV